MDCKKIFFRLLTVISATLQIFLANAQEKPEIKFVDASSFPVFGKCIENTSARYERLPAEYESVSRPPVWNLGRNSAGVYVRFRSDSPIIYARWENTFKNIMNHMTPTGNRGLDLYFLNGDTWRFVGSGRPDLKNRQTEAKIIGNMTRSMREYMLYLPLYDGVTSLEIGVDPSSVIEAPAVDSPRSDRPIVMYGTSILQGGCANRPGMAFTGILGRRLDREVINLGFSGNAQLDYEIAELMTKVPSPAVYVLDYVPNTQPEQINERGEKFFRIIRDAHPDVPVVFVEAPEYAHAVADTVVASYLVKRNSRQKALFQKLKAQGEKKIYYVTSASLIGDDGEATVDGTHFTDLGMVRYSDKLEPVLRKILRKEGLR